jgi:histidinol-phosphate aminotransferase
MTALTPKKGVMDIPLYTPGQATQDGVHNPIKLSANENALGCSPKARQAYLNEAANLRLYPDMRAESLRAALGAKFNLEPRQLIFGAGSDELFALACHTYLNAGDNIVQAEFGFAAWAIVAKAAGGIVKSAPETNFCVDVDALFNAVDERTRIVFIANPANPTGTVIPFSKIKRFHAALRPDVLLVLDGAYAEFNTGEDGALEEFALAQSADNVLVTRTFSKLYGLASLRLGWGFGAPSLIGALERLRLPFNTTRAAQAAAVAALADTDFTQRSIRHVEQERAALTRFIQERGFEVIPSAANFLTVRFDHNTTVSADKMAQRLADDGILVRGLRNYGLADCLRITIGTAEELGCLRAAVDKVRIATRDANIEQLQAPPS